MRGILLAIAILMAASHAKAEAPLTLTGNAVEGGLLMGRTAPGAQVSLNGAAVEVAGDGHFLLGFGREDAGTVALEVRVGGEVLSRTITVADRTFKIERIDGLPQRKVTPMDPKDLARIKKEKAEIAGARQTRASELGYLMGFRWPATGRISGVYGSQRVLNGKPRRPHYGTDIAVPEGTPVGAVADGRVVFVHPGMFFNGKTVLLDHGLGLRSIYIHLSRTDVAVGDLVKAGDIIGAVGKTGRATGPHLHFTMTLDNIQLDPEVVLGPMK